MHSNSNQLFHNIQYKTESLYYKSIHFEDIAKALVLKILERIGLRWFAIVVYLFGDLGCCDLLYFQHSSIIILFEA